ncbi:hypothetical protein HYX58_01070 [Candidatus Dependentiae bacterium]|nr:hypothetical protein [Candidatus Dependentiae bacterium]
MKKVLLNFEISKENRIEVFFSDEINKFNYFYEPSEKLHVFDEVNIALYMQNKQIILAEDPLRDGVESLYNQLIRAKQGLISLPKGINIGTLSYHINESTYLSEQVGGKRLINSMNFSVWSLPAGKAQTYMYTSQNKLYLEIGVFYRWHYIERTDADIDYIPYEDFIKNYKPILVDEVTNEMASNWMQQCESLLKQLVL